MSWVLSVLLASQQGHIDKHDGVKSQAIVDFRTDP
jgi:hypothetical protein